MVNSSTDKQQKTQKTRTTSAHHTVHKVYSNGNLVSFKWVIAYILIISE